MRSSHRHHAAAAPLLVLLGACAGNPAPGDPGYPFNVSGPYAATFEVEGEAYRGSARLATARGGAVEGTFRVTEPIGVTGDLRGAVAGDTLRFDMTYLMVDQGCGGIGTGRGPVAEGGTLASGIFEIVDGCGDGDTLRGTFRFESALRLEGGS